MLKLILFISTLFGPPTAAASSTAPVLEAPTCEPRGETARKYTHAERAETRARVKAVCEFTGAKPWVCAFLDAVVVRESDGRAGVRHHAGRNENGLGAMGISLRWHRDKWPGKDEDPMLCHPEVSALIALDIMDRAFRKYHAENAVDVQSIYAGRWECWTNPETGKRRCAADANQRTVSAICDRMKARGHSCWKHVQRSDLGRRIPKRDRRKVAARLIHDFNAKSKAD
jgi:hypothetical protein